MTRQPLQVLIQITHSLHPLIYGDFRMHIESQLDVMLSFSLALDEKLVSKCIPTHSTKESSFLPAGSVCMFP